MSTEEAATPEWRLWTNGECGIIARSAEEARAEHASNGGYEIEKVEPFVERTAPVPVTFVDDSPEEVRAGKFPEGAVIEGNRVTMSPADWVRFVNRNGARISYLWDDC